MKKIMFKGKTVGISAAHERLLRILQGSGYAAKKEPFVEGSSIRYQNTIIPKEPGLRELLGVREVKKQNPTTRREKDFFKKNNRVFFGIFGNKRRVDALLSLLDRGAS